MERRVGNRAPHAANPSVATTTQQGFDGQQSSAARCLTLGLVQVQLAERLVMIASLGKRNNAPTDVGLFDGISRRQQLIARQLSTHVKVDTGRVLCRAGSLGSEFFVIASGRVAVERVGGSRVELGEGDSFGELALLASTPRGQRTATVVALEPTELLVYERRDFLQLVEACPAVATRLLRKVGGLAAIFAAETGATSGLDTR